MDPQLAFGLTESLRLAIFAHGAFVFSGLLLVSSAITKHTQYLRKRDQEKR